MWKSILGAAALLGLVVGSASAAQLKWTGTVLSGLGVSGGESVVGLIDIAYVNLPDGVSDPEFSDFRPFADRFRISLNGTTIFDSDAPGFAVSLASSTLSASQHSGSSSSDIFNEFLGSTNFARSNLRFLAAATVYDDVNSMQSVLGGLENFVSINLASPSQYSSTIKGQSFGFDYDVTSVEFTTAVPIPAALPLLATALGGFGLLSWRKHRRTTAQPFKS